jgi:hypothetical protein
MATIAAIRSVIYDICLPVTITYETESFQVDKAWIGGAFVLGILFGILATAFCVPIFIRDYFKKILHVSIQSNLPIQSPLLSSHLY